MSGDMRPYVVRQGDYLVKLAFVHGFDVDEVWNDAKNEEIRGRRGDHNILAPGDIVYLPVKEKEGLPIVKGATNRYTARVPKVTIRIVLLEGGVPVANALFAVEGLPEPLSGTTAEDGCVTFEAPITVREVSIVLPERNLLYPVRIGDLDPANERSGAAMRLAHLGCYGWFPEPGSDFDEDQHRLAVATFQEMIGGDSTGECDDATLGALQDKHGV